jgi:hypothetical protein
METLQTLWADLQVHMQAGFYQINALQGLLIAMGAAYFLHNWSHVFALAGGATLVHVIFDTMLPVLANSAAFLLPPLVDGQYWGYLFTLYVGYVLVITVFYIVKRSILRSRSQPA